MARQTNLFKLKKLLDNAGIQKSSDGLLSKKKPSTSIETIAEHPVIRRARKKTAEFACAGAAARLMLLAFEEMIRAVPDSGLTNRLVDATMPCAQTKKGTMGKFIIVHRSNGTCKFNLLAGNGKIVLTSAGYASKKTCKKSIGSVRRNAADNSKYEKKTAADGKYYFCLKSTNGLVIGVSETYDSLQAIEKGIKAVKLNAGKGPMLGKNSVNTVKL